MTIQEMINWLEGFEDRSIQVVIPMHSESVLVDPDKCEERLMAKPRKSGSTGGGEIIVGSKKASVVKLTPLLFLQDEFTVKGIAIDEN